MLAVSALATGAIGPNPPQSGVSTFTANTWTNTITFAYPFQSVPVINSFYVSGATNSLPFTNNAVTTTNFNIIVNTTNSLGTNQAVIAWQAYVGGTRLESGTNALVAATPLSIVFPFPYAVPPTVVASGSSTNAAVSVTIGISGISTTNFTAASGTAQMVSWIAVGTVASPQSPNSGLNPQNNTVLY